MYYNDDKQRDEDAKVLRVLREQNGSRRAIPLSLSLSFSIVSLQITVRYDRKFNDVQRV